MKRYDYIVDYTDNGMIEDPKGEYIKWDDLMDALERVKAKMGDGTTEHGKEWWYWMHASIMTEITGES